MIGTAPKSLLSHLLILIFLALTTCGKDSPTGPPTPSSVTVTPASATLTAIGQTIQLYGVVDRNGKTIAGASVTWTSSNATVASVSPGGLVTAHQTGTATITATSSGVSGQAVVKVETPVVAGIILTTPDTLLAALGQTKRINASVRDQTGRSLSNINLTWSSSDTTVASVDSTGLVTAIGNGETDIMASAGSSVGTLRIYVQQRSVTLTVSTKSISLSVGATHQLTGTVFDINGHVIVGASPYYRIDVPVHRFVVQVDRSGLVTALKEGTATITASTGELFSVRIEVTVTAEGTIVQPTIAVITVSPAAFTMDVGDTVRLQAKATDADGNPIDIATFLWASSDESIASVDTTGLVTGRGRGRATINAGAGNASGSSDVMVIIPERVVLAALFESTKGTEWNESSGWLSDEPLSDWYGVTTGTDDRIIGLRLNDNNLNGSIPFELGDLEQLADLDLSNNALTGPLPYTMTRLNLRSLRLNDTGLCAPSTTEMGAWLQGIQDRSLIAYCVNPDREALIAIYIATDGPNWRRQANWLTDAPIGDWHGVTTDRNGRVIAYDSDPGFTCNNLTGAIPAEIGDLDMLQHLDLGCGHLNGLIPPEISKLNNLRYLSLRGNELIGPIPAELGNLTNLEVLYLSTNPTLGGPIPPELGNLAKLDSLGVGRCNLSGVIPSELGRMESLEALSAFENNLSGPIPPELGDLKNLKRLVLSDNELTGQIPPELGDLINLDTMFLSGNQLTGQIPPELSNIDVLRILDLQNNLLTGNIPAQFGNFDTLQRLLVSNNRLSGSFPSAIEKMDILRNLALSSNEFSGEIPTWLGDIETLKYVRLDNNRFSGPLPAELSKLTILYQLHLHKNDLSGPIPLEISQLEDIHEFWFDGTQLCVPADLEFQRWLQGIENARITVPCENPDRAALAVFYETTNGTQWTVNQGWLNDIPIAQWHGVTTNENGRVTKLNLDNNNLTGSIPPELVALSELTELSLSGNSLRRSIPPDLGGLVYLERLDLSDNQLTGAIVPEMSKLVHLEELDLSNNMRMWGPLPNDLRHLVRLRVLRLEGTRLCSPLTGFWALQFSRWIENIPDASVTPCMASAMLRAYLTQAIQSFNNPVPLVAGESSMLRVFYPVADQEIVARPPVRATFYHGGAPVHSIDVQGRPPIETPVSLTYSLSEVTAQAEVPGWVVAPGLEWVIETDPDGILEPGPGIGVRLPESGLQAVEVTDVPTLDLTIVPFLWNENPDRTILSATEYLTAEDDLFWQTRDLLPVQDFSLTVREFVWTSVDPVTDNIAQIARETSAVRTLDGGQGHYMGILRDFVGAIATSGGRVAVAPLSGQTIVHELGHNMSLGHAPCGPVGSDIDPHYPYIRGSIGVWGADLYDVYKSGSRRVNDRVIPPDSPDIMGYCSAMPWISDYHFRNAIEYRLTEEVIDQSTVVASTQSLLLWGGFDENGKLVLEPAFAVDAEPSVPSGYGPHRVTGLDADDRVLFSMDFTMDSMADSEGGAFSFILPVQSSWKDDLYRIELSGPEGVATVGRNGESAVAMLKDRFSGQVRGFLRDVPTDRKGSVSGRRILPEPGLDVLISMGVPVQSDW